MRYVVVLLTDDGTGKMDSIVKNPKTAHGVAYSVGWHLNPNSFIFDWKSPTHSEISTSVGHMRPMDLLFFGDSNRCAYVHRTQ